MIHDLRPYPAMRDSGVPWLDHVPAHWSVCRLRGILRRVTERNRPDMPLLSVVRERGVIRRDATDRDENHNYIPDDLSNYKVVRIGQFALNKMKAWQGSYGVSQYEGIVSPAYFVFSLSGVVGRFFHTAIRSRAYVPAFAQASDGVRIGQWDLAESRMREIPFAIPAVSEQVAIVGFLDHADRRLRRCIRGKQKLIKLLEDQKQAIIHRAVTRGLDPNVRLKASGFDWIGEVPEHWEILKLKQLSHRISGRLVYQPAQYFSDEGVPFLMANNITPDGISWIDVKRIPEEVNARFAGCALRAGDVVTVRVGAPGVTCVVPREADGLNCGSLMIIRRSARFNPSWLAYVMNGMLFRHQIALVQYGAAQKQFNITDAVNFLVPTPPREEQDKIADWADTESRPLDAAIRATRRQIGVIREYRTRLIADVVTGKLDVREAAARLPDEVEEPEPLDEDEAEGGADGVADDADAAPEAEA